MKILHVITSLLTGGAEKLMVDLLPRLRDLGNEVELLIFYGKRTPFYEQLELKGIKIHVLGMNKNMYNPINIIKLKRFIGKYDIIHTHNTACQLFTAIASIGTKQIICTTEHNTSNRRRGNKFYAIIDCWMYSRYKKIICISEGTEAELKNSIKGIKSDLTLVIPNGIDVRKYSEALPAAKESSEWKGKHIIMQVAAFREQKDQDTIIRAMTHLPKDYHAVFVGDDIRKEFCENLAKEIGVEKQCSFLGIRSDVPQLIKAADVIVMSSHWEGFGLAAVEGMAAGKPVVASDVAGIREIVKDAGVLFPPHDDQQLAKEIIHLIEDQAYADQIIRQCQIRAMEFDISVMANGYNQTYNVLKTKNKKTFNEYNN